jgi:spermidine synthase
LKPFRTLATTTTPSGAKVTLHEHDGQYYLKLNGRQLMSTTCTTSELLLGDLACEGLRGRADTRVLIGGLGLGFSLQRVLELVGRHAQVEVAELLPDVVEWNRELLRNVNGVLLKDPRLKVLIEDVLGVIRRVPPESYDAILLDVDNGPGGALELSDPRLYSRRGLASIERALKPNGKVAFWSAAPNPSFAEHLVRFGFLTKSFPAREHDRAKYEAHVIYVATRRANPAPPRRSLNPTTRP